MSTGQQLRSSTPGPRARAPTDGRKGPPPRRRLRPAGRGAAAPRHRGAGRYQHASAHRAGYRDAVLVPAGRVVASGTHARRMVELFSAGGQSPGRYHRAARPPGFSMVPSAGARGFGGRIRQQGAARRR